VIQSAARTRARRSGDYCRSARYARAYSVRRPGAVRLPLPHGERFLFQNGRQDPDSPEADVDALVRAAKGRRSSAGTTHRTSSNDQARDERDAWLVQLLAG
jgi:hypothetical protein